MLPLTGQVRIVCADPSGERLERLRLRLRSEGFNVICTRTAADCLSVAAELCPDVVVLDSDFLSIDSENIPEYITRISAGSRVLLTVDDPFQWKGTHLQYVAATIKRGDLDTLVDMIHRSD